MYELLQLLSLLARLPRLVQEFRRHPGCRLQVGVGLAIVGPFLAIFFMMGGDLVPVLTTLAGSCGLAGYLAAAAWRGIPGALTLLAIPLIWLVAAVGLGAPVDFVVGFVLIQAASTEAGYFVGRLVAGGRRPQRGT